jgi:hypothetical protein
MMKVIVFTLIGLSLVYMLQWSAMKRTNRTTRWMSILVLLSSGALWVYLRMTIEIPRPADWLIGMLSPWVPVP